MRQNNCFVDLHTHSNASDGQYSPSELVHLARKASVEILALTDHDTTAGLQEARRTADAVRSGLDPEEAREIERRARTEPLGDFFSELLSPWIR